MKELWKQCSNLPDLARPVFVPWIPRAQTWISVGGMNHGHRMNLVCQVLINSLDLHNVMSRGSGSKCPLPRGIPGRYSWRAAECCFTVATPPPHETSCNCARKVPKSCGSCSWYRWGQTVSGPVITRLCPANCILWWLRKSKGCDTI